MNNTAFIFIAPLLLATTLVSILRFIRFYNSYQEHLKKYHPDEYKELVYKDSIVRELGEWTRWPVGSAGPIIAIFNVKQFFGDRALQHYQKRAIIWLSVFFVSFAITLFVLATYRAT